MDTVFKPGSRNWISEEVHLGTAADNTSAATKLLASVIGKVSDFEPDWVECAEGELEKGKIRHLVHKSRTDADDNSDDDGELKDAEELIESHEDEHIDSAEEDTAIRAEKIVASLNVEPKHSDSNAPEPKSSKSSKPLKKVDFFKIKLKDEYLYNADFATEVNNENTEGDVYNDYENGAEYIMDFYGDIISEKSDSDASDTEEAVEAFVRSLCYKRQKVRPEQAEKKSRQVTFQSPSSEEKNDVSVAGSSRILRNAAPLKGMVKLEKEPVSSEKPSATTPSSSGTSAPGPEVSTEGEGIPKNAEDACYNKFRIWSLKQNLRDASKRSNRYQTICMGKYGYTKEEFRKRFSAVDVGLTTVIGEVYRDGALKRDSVNPSIAPPVPEEPRYKLKTLGVGVAHVHDPTEPQWKSANIQHQINEDLQHEARVKRLLLQKELLRTNEKEMVCKDDIVVFVTFYKPGDCGDQPPDDAKFFPRSQDCNEVRVGGLKAKRKRKSFTDHEGASAPPPSNNRMTEPKISMTFEVLGSNTLEQLRDAFLCETDYIALKEVDHPNFYNTYDYRAGFSKDKYPGSILCIGNVAYTDERDDANEEYVAQMNSWHEKVLNKISPQQLDPFTRGDMKNTRVRDLTLRFGYPYVYIHQGTCQHLVTFTKARWFHEDDHLIAKDYPRTISANFKNMFCRIDNEALARWVVFGFPDLPENPMFLCTECVKMYCYKPEGGKKKPFQLYPMKQLADRF